MSLTSSSNFPTSSLQSALDVLLRNEFSPLDLPIDPTDLLWERLEKDFQLTLGQLSALRNYVKSQSIPHSPTTTSKSGLVAATVSEAKHPKKRKNSRKVEVKEEKLAATTLVPKAVQFGM